MVRVLPDIPNIKAHWAHRCSEVPEWLEVPMSNGRIYRYYPQVAQPAFHDAMRNVRNMKEMCIGYEKPADAATSNRPKRKINRGYDTTETEK